MVHKKLLTSQSAYFNKALNGGFREAAENSIHLEEEDPASITLLVGFLYRGVIPGIDKKLNAFLIPTAFISPQYQNQPPNPAHSTSGSLYPFRPIMTSPANSIAGMYEVIQHLSSLPQYLLFSPEEIRAADYKAGRKYTNNPIGVSGSTSQHTRSVQQPRSSSAFILNRFSTRQPPRSLWDLRAHELSEIGRGRPFASPANPHSLSQPFGSSRYIVYPPSARVCIHGIAESKPFGGHCLATEEYQLAVLRLCILAEKILWPELFNAAVERYIHGELHACRDLPAEHVDVIFGSSSHDSTLRTYVIETICWNSQQNNSKYLPVAKKYDDFMEVILSKVSEARRVQPLVWNDKSIRRFWMGSNRPNSHKSLYES